MRISRQRAGLMFGAAMVVAGVAASSMPADATPRIGSEVAGTPGTASVLKAVTCTKSANCWAVGFYEVNGATLNQVLHWNGKHWSLFHPPSPGGTKMGALSELFGVRCLSAANCWAVGFYLKHDAELGEALHWNGKHWSLVATPTPGGTLTGDVNQLSDVACTSPGNCWASGQYGHFSGMGEVALNLVLHWNGKHWSRTRTPNPGGTMANDANELQSIRCVFAKDCWAVGTYGLDSTTTVKLSNEILRWNGKKWSKASAPNPAGTAMGDQNSLRALSCTSASACWAVGAYGTTGMGSTTLNEVLHWNGKKWSKQSVPNPDGTGADASNALAAISCSAPKSCWAVGTLGGSLFGTFTEALNWNGTTWSFAGVPDPGGNSSFTTNMLAGLRCTSPAICWAVGDKAGVHQANSDMILRWNGTNWSNHTVG